MTEPDQEKSDKICGNKTHNEKSAEAKPQLRIPPNYIWPTEPGEEKPQKMKLADFRLMAMLSSDKRHTFDTYERYQVEQTKEFEDIEKYERALQDRAYKEKQVEDATSLARELNNLKKQEFTEAKLRQQLRANSHELRDLERQLKAAYVNKELAAQIAQNEAIKLNEKKHAQQAYEVMKQAYISEKEDRKRQAEEELIKKAEYKKELQDQLIMREKSKRYLYEEFLREKKLIDDVVQRIHDEDMRERAEKMCKVKRTREEIAATQQAQEEWKKKRIAEMEEENRKITEYLMNKHSGEKERLEAKQKKVEEMERISENIAIRLIEEKEIKKERDDIVQALDEEELRAKSDKRYKDDLEKKLRIRLDTKLTLTQQMKDREEKLRLQREEDRKYKEKVIAQMEADAKLEQLSEEKKRLKKIQMRKDVQNLLAERRALHAEEFQLLMGIEEEDRKQIELRNKIIEEERINLLKEHVQQLIGYLPKGLLRPEDMPHLSTDIVQQFQTRQETPFQPKVHRKR